MKQLRSDFNHAIKNNKLFLFFIFVLFLLQLIRVFFVFPSVDESYYMTEPLRLVQGDVLFRDSWDVLQTHGIFLAPFYFIYTIIFGTEGIILFGRLLYFVFSLITAMLIYHTMRQDVSKRLAASVSIMILIYAPFSLYTIGYNQLLYLFGIAGTMLFYIGLKETLINRKKSTLFCFFSGVVHAAMIASYVSSVILLPVLLLIIYLLNFAYNKKKNRRNKKPFLWYILGLAVIALLFIAYVFLIVKWDNFLLGLRQMFVYSNNTNSTDITYILYTLVLVTFKGLFSGIKMRVFLFLLFVITVWVAGSRIFNKLFPENNSEFKVVNSIAIIFSMIWIILCILHVIRAFSDPVRNNLMTIDLVTFIFMLLPLMLLLPVKDEYTKWKWFILLVVLSICQAVLVSTTSGGLWYQSRYALIGGSMYVLLMLGMQVQELLNDNMSSRFFNMLRKVFLSLGILSLSVALLAFIGFQYYDTYGSYTENYFFSNNVLVRDGPAKGIFVREKYALFNESLTKDIRKHSRAGKGILSLEVFPYAYGVDKSMHMLTQNPWAATLYTRGSYTDNIYLSPIMEYFEHRKETPYMIVYYGKDSFLENPDPNYVIHSFIIDNYELVESYNSSDDIYYTIFLEKEKKIDY